MLRFTLIKPWGTHSYYALPQLSKTVLQVKTSHS